MTEDEFKSAIVKIIDQEVGATIYHDLSGVEEAADAIIALSRTAAPALAQAVLEKGEAFQPRVLPWLIECFGAEIASDRVERCDRFIEEALELAQSLDWTADRAHALVDYVFGRPKGEPHQEVGGVMVTLAALCQAVDLDMHKAGDDELARIMQPEIVTTIRAKQAAKPTGSALPVRQARTALKDKTNG